ncbi:helix-turn-helix transcriptional regulator [Geopseudomonas aromaticivorans]
MGSPIRKGIASDAEFQRIVCISANDPSSGSGGFLFALLGFSTPLENQAMAQIAHSTTTAAPNLPIPGTFGTTEQLRTRFQVSRTTWWRWSKTAGFPEPIRFGRSVRWPVEAVEAFLTQQGA